MASGRQVEYSLKLNSNASSVLQEDTQAANKFDNSMWQVQKTLASFGLGLGAHFLIDAAKDWTQAAADYEQAMLRIKNASHEGLGALNQEFINKQVDNFKLKLQESADAYGNFLFKIKNAGLSNDVSNRLFENLTVVGKVGGIPQEQMDATVRNVGILLGEGVLEARHLRQLSYVHPQIVPYLADALGLKSGEKDEFSGLFKQDISDETAQQKLSQLISSGKLTKLGLNSNIILEAFEKYRLSIENKLPETLDTVQSHLNSLSVTWERFKNSLILDQKSELLQFFHDLENGIHWLVEHEEGIIRIGKNIYELVKLYAEWRIALLALEVPFGIFKFFTGEYERLLRILGLYSTASQSIFGETSRQTLAYRYEAEAINEVSTALIRLKDIQSESGFSYIRNSSGDIVGTMSKEEEVAGAGLAAETGEITTISGGILAALSSTGAIALGIVTLTGALIYGFDKLSDSLDKNKKDAKQAEYDAYKQESYNYLIRGGISDLNDNAATGGKAIDKYTFLAKRQHEMQGTELENSLEKRLDSGKFNSKSLLNHVEEFYKDLYADKNTLDLVTLKQGYRTGEEENRKRNLVYEFLEREQQKFEKEDSESSASKIAKKKLNLPDEYKHLRGNSSNYFTVHIDTMNGINAPVFQNTNKQTMEDVKQMVGVEITRNMLEIINDIQVVRNGH